MWVRCNLQMFNYYLQLIVDESPCAAVITLTLIVAKYVSGKIGIYLAPN